jgi:TRAP-type C4-dicarboxylate transport system permease small subunit
LPAAVARQFDPAMPSPKPVVPPDFADFDIADSNFGDFDFDFDEGALDPGVDAVVLEPWEYLFAVPAALTLLGLVGLTFVDVLGRYFFDHPVRGATELVELSMVVLVFLGLPLVTRHGEHLALDFLDKVVSARTGRMIAAVMGVMMGGCLFWLAWLMVLKGLDIGRSGDATMVLSIALSPFVLFIAFAAAVDGIVNIALAMRTLRELRQSGMQRRAAGTAPRR